MRLSLSVKVLIMFSALTIMTLVLSLTFYSGYKENISSNHRIVLLKDFILQIEKLQSLTKTISINQRESQVRDFESEIKSTRDIIKRITRLYSGVSPVFEKRLIKLPGHVDSFHRAFNELVLKYSIRNKLPTSNRELFKTLREHSTLVVRDHERFSFILNELWMLNMQIYHHHDLKKFPELKQQYANAKALTADDRLLGTVQALIHNLEKDYLNHLAIKNREAFVFKTSNYFFSLADDAIQEAIAQDQDRHQRNYLIILAISIVAVCLNIVLWFMASRYFNNFILNQKQAIKAIETDNYGYGFPAASDDEIGDLSKAMKELAQSLLKSKERYRRLIDQAADSVFVAGMDGRIIDVNKQACLSLGYTRQALLETNVGQIDVTAIEENHKAVFWNTMTPEKPVTIHGIHKRSDGSTFPVEVRIGVHQTREYDSVEGKIQIPEGKIMISFARDMTQRKKAEMALKQSEEKYRSMMENMEDPVYICSPEFKVEYLNPAMIRRLGRDATGESCHSAVHDLPQKCHWCQYEKISENQHYTLDILSPKDGRSYLVSSSPITQPDGTVSKLSIYRDVTELKRLESQLQQSQKMESIGTLAGGIAHDFNNILFPILGYTEMMLDDAPAGSTQEKHLNEVYHGAQRAKELIKQILTFSRQDTGELSVVKMQPIVKEVLKLIRSSIPSTIDITHDIHPECRMIKADPTKIHQIIMNLATNAYHAMQETGGELRVTLKETQVANPDSAAPGIMPGLYNCLTVSDTGIGMDNHLIEKIFDPYFTTKEKGKGTGMGLSVVHGIVSGMGGAISVTSEPGNGSRFNVYFPAVREMAPGRKTDEIDVIQGGSERILLVDDEVSIITMLKQILERMGYQVTADSNPADALIRFQSDPFSYDLVITDLSMPKMSGDQLAEAVLSTRPDIPIILNTGFNDQLDSEALERIGVHGLLLKPIVKTELAQAIRNVLDGVN